MGIFFVFCCEDGMRGEKQDKKDFFCEMPKEKKKDQHLSSAQATGFISSDALHENAEAEKTFCWTRWTRF